MIDPRSDEERAKLTRLGLLGNKVITVFIEEHCSIQEGLTCLEEVFKYLSGLKEREINGRHN